MEDSTFLKGNKHREYPGDDEDDDKKPLVNIKETSPEESAKILHEMLQISKRIEEVNHTYILKFFLF